MSTRHSLFLASLFALVFSVSCGGNRTTPATDPTPASETSEETLSNTGTSVLDGFVTAAYAADACPWLLQVTTRGAEEWLIPIALDERYLVEGQRLRFTARPSRASSGSCSRGRPAILEEVRTDE